MARAGIAFPLPLFILHLLLLLILPLLRLTSRVLLSLFLLSCSVLPFCRYVCTRAKEARGIALDRAAATRSSHRESLRSTLAPSLLLCDFSRSRPVIPVLLQLHRQFSKFKDGKAKNRMGHVAGVVNDQKHLPVG